jgi:hypothetical protein
MDRQTTFLVALGMLVAAATVVGLCGWVLFARDRTFAKSGVGVSGSPGRAPEHQGHEGS